MNDQENIKPLDRNIYITGFMASGKSTLGKKLSELTGTPFRDLDQLIENRESSSITDIFKWKGEEYFRKQEKQYLIETLDNYKGIVSLGGGALQNQDLVEHVKRNGVLIFLKTPLEVIAKRVHGSSHRPIRYDENNSIKTIEVLYKELKALYLKRLDLYEQAHFTIDTTNFETELEMAESVLEKLKENA